MPTDDIKVILLGGSGTGKTSLMMKYFDPGYDIEKTISTTGLGYKQDKFWKNERLWNVGVWDTAGQERFNAVMRSYYRNANGAILCFDPSKMESWNNVQYWYDEIQKNVDDCKFYVCANKKDLINSYRVDIKAVKHFVREIQAKYFYVSCKTGEGVDDIFKVIYDDCISNKDSVADKIEKNNNCHNVNGSGNIVVHTNITKNGNGGCC